jgi:Domain of unknown function (DUF5658)
MRTARCVYIAILWMAISAPVGAQSGTGSGGGVPAPQVEQPRPAALLPLYGSLAVMQALDVDSTLKALGGGLHEGNPLLRSASPAALVAIKAGATASMIVVSERLRKRHPKVAVVLMAGINAAYTMVAIHNYSALRHVR